MAEHELSMGRTEASGTDRRFAWCSCCGRKRLCDIADPVLCDECRENTQTDAEYDERDGHA